MTIFDLYILGYRFHVEMVPRFEHSGLFKHRVIHFLDNADGATIRYEKFSSL